MARWKEWYVRFELDFRADELEISRLMEHMRPQAGLQIFVSQKVVRTQIVFYEPAPSVAFAFANSIQRIHNALRKAKVPATVTVVTVNIMSREERFLQLIGIYPGIAEMEKI